MVTYMGQANPDESPDPDEVPLEEHLDQQIHALEHRLAKDPPTDPELRARLERDLDLWRRQRKTAAAPDWGDGRGDRTLF